MLEIQIFLALSLISQMPAIHGDEKTNISFPLRLYRVHYDNYTPRVLGVVIYWFALIQRYFHWGLASTTALALLDGVPKEVVAGVGAVSTMLAAASSFLKSADRRQTHEKASRGFQSLMVKMISCETEKDYEKYWADFNREVMEEPMMPKKFVKKFQMRYTMTPELREV